MPKEPMGSLQLMPRRWYAWQLLPGYLNNSQPYYSPIYVTHVVCEDSEQRIFKLAFFNVLYLDGAQDFSARLKVIHYHPEFLVARLLYADDSLNQVAIISRIDFGWLNQHCHHVTERNPPALFGRNAEKSITTYLNRAFPYVRERMAHFT